MGTQQRNTHHKLSLLPARLTGERDGLCSTPYCVIIPENGGFVKQGGKVQMCQPSVPGAGASGVPCFVKEPKTGYNTPHQYSLYEE
jgi:hypothetical protein